jgi:hypothetical protein
MAPPFAWAAHPFSDDDLSTAAFVSSIFDEKQIA